ncbi:hypothetical protein [Bradyrhizobium sp. CCBAU 21360]|uniref:hypothetical protein n=1 Tax=Bradyrhizobium sp. CCBAU 21360 TaxID=1325081 RepID=UPI00230523F4|nr:hypothetical protein [Bradyrhizobium sp. CCBAU 21360]MDA9452315.1 hypothetical protein [Bradyrhizobium sp. CCBAU 21360]
MQVDYVEEALRELEARVNEVAAEIAEENYDVIQEPAFTSRLAQEITSEIRRHPINVGGVKIEVTSVDVPSLGSTMEKDIGADLYISVVRRDKQPPASKGMLVQSKWDKTIGDKRLPGQMGQMIERTPDSYVWSFGPNGVMCGKVYKTPTGPSLDSFEPLGRLVANGLRCTAGDPRIGRDLRLSRKDAMRRKLRELQINSGLSFTLRNILRT